MSTRQFSVSTAWVGIAAAIASATLASAQPVRLATGPSSAADGYLDFAPDEYGAVAQPFAAGQPTNNDDHFNPAGTTGGGVPHPLQAVCFTNGFYIFVGGVERELLSDYVAWQGTGGIGTDPTLTRTITCPNVASDTNGDTVNDRATSAFTVTNIAGTTNLSFFLDQTVRATTAGSVAAVEQNYTIRNNALTPISFVLLRAVDGDLIYTAASAAGFATDEVGTSCNTAGIGQFAVERDRDTAAAGASYDSTGLVVYGGADGRFYVGGKQNHTPPGAPPVAMGFGTDVQYWNNFGIPTTWQNYVATVGTNVDGFNAFIPSGAGAGQTQDAFIGLDYALTLAAGETRTIQVGLTYGQITPVPLRPPCPTDLNGDRVTDLSDLTLLLAAYGASGPCQPADLDHNGTVDINDLAALLARFGIFC
jgi:hypothetical protein